MTKEVRCLERGIVQRSGKWSVQGNLIAMQEVQRKEITGCLDKKAATGKKGKNKRSEPGLNECREPEFSVVVNDAPTVNRVSVEECPENQEAKKMDANYICLSIAGKVFWRQPDSENIDAAAFFGEQ